MSYILDALRKSESERRQGRVPDLGQQVQWIHKPKKRAPTALVWVVAALFLNAAVLAYVFWPTPAEKRPTAEPAATGSTEPAPVSEEQEIQSGQTPRPEIAARPETDARETVGETPAVEPNRAEQASVSERPTIIVPSKDRLQRTTEPARPSSGDVPHLVEMPLEFQKSIPDLMFNSHIYASDPASRRVMINNNYLKAGDSFSGLRVEQITEQGVVLSRNGRLFRVGIVRDWVSPR